MDRRQVLKWGTIGAIGFPLAGCSGNGWDTENSNQNTGKTTELTKREETKSANKGSEGTTESVRETLEDRLKGVSPADSYEATIGLSKSSAEPFYQAEDVTDVNLDKSSVNDETHYYVDFTFGDEAEQIQETATDLGSDLRRAKIFEYLDGGLVNTRGLSLDLIDQMESGEWAADPSFGGGYDEKELAERIAATVLKHINS